MKSWYPNAYFAVVVLAAVCAAMQPGHASMPEQQASAWLLDSVADSVADSAPAGASDRETDGETTSATGTVATPSPPDSPPAPH